MFYIGNYFGDGWQWMKVRAMPGPTRQLYRNKLFGSVEGLEALFERLIIRLCSRLNVLTF